LLGEDLANMPDLEAVASRCCMSSRTLKRKLAEHGVTFSELVAAIRRDEAQLRLAEGRLSVEQIAGQLGYRDPANFTRAFKSWTGETPRQYRDAVRRASVGPEQTGLVSARFRVIIRYLFSPESPRSPACPALPSAAIWLNSSATTPLLRLICA
jgi:AraC-like DNA-binding protein